MLYARAYIAPAVILILCTAPWLLLGRQGANIDTAVQATCCAGEGVLTRRIDCPWFPWWFGRYCARGMDCDAWLTGYYAQTGGKDETLVGNFTKSECCAECSKRPWCDAASWRPFECALKRIRGGTIDFVHCNYTSQCVTMNKKWIYTDDSDSRALEL
jgi:hypothetical protein